MQHEGLEAGRRGGERHNTAKQAGHTVIIPASRQAGEEVRELAGGDPRRPGATCPSSPPQRPDKASAPSEPNPPPR